MSPKQVMAEFQEVRPVVIQAQRALDVMKVRAEFQEVRPVVFQAQRALEVIRALVVIRAELEAAQEATMERAAGTREGRDRSRRPNS